MLHGSLGVVCKTNKLASTGTFIHDHHVFEAQRSVLSIKDKQSIIVRLEKGEKGTNLASTSKIVSY